MAAQTSDHILGSATHHRHQTWTREAEHKRLLQKCKAKLCIISFSRAPQENAFQITQNHSAYQLQHGIRNGMESWEQSVVDASYHSGEGMTDI